MVNRKTRTILLLALVGVVLSSGARAQPGLGEITQRPGSEVDSQTRATLTGNRSTAQVSATGGQAGSVNLSATAQVNAIGLSGLNVRNSSVSVLQNQVAGLVSARGGTAAVNAALISNGAGRRPLSDSQVTLSGNEAGNVQAVGAKASAGIELGSRQMAGRASANSVLIDESDVRRASISMTDNSATGVQAIGAFERNGRALAQRCAREPVGPSERGVDNQR